MKTNMNGLLQGRITRWGLVAAVVTVMATSALAQTSGKARPFKAVGIVTGTTANSDVTGSIDIAGTATHLGKFVSRGNYEITGFTDGIMTLHVWGNFTAANGDTVEIDFPTWVVDYNANPPTSMGVASFKGGTGRFANASGSYVATFSGADLEIYTAEGTISY